MFIINKFVVSQGVSSFLCVRMQWKKFAESFASVSCNRGVNYFGGGVCGVGGGIIIKWLILEEPTKHGSISSSAALE